MPLIRSALFHIAFYSITAILVLACMFTLPFSRRGVIIIARFWAKLVIKAFTTIVGGTYEVRGLHNLPHKTNLILAAKHMSVFETFALIPLIDDPLFILKRELMWVPFFGWAVAKGDMIPIDRGARSKALRIMLERARKKMANQVRQLIIFPEGTRRPVDAEPLYKYGISHIYKALDIPCYPVALNTGLFWPRKSFRLYPGKIIVEIFPAIEPGLEQNSFFEKVSSVIETNSDRLIAEARAESNKLPRKKSVG